MRFRADPKLVHERVLLRRLGVERFWAVTPDRKVVELDLGDTGAKGRVIEGVDYLLGRNRAPNGVRSKDCFLAKHSMKDEFYDDEVQKLMKKVLEMLSVGGDPSLPTRRLKKKVTLDDEEDDDKDKKKDAGRKEVPKKGAPKKSAAKQAVDEDSDSEDDEVNNKKGIWMVVVGENMTTGTLIEPPGGTLSLRGEKFAIFPPRRLGELPLVLNEVEIDEVQVESLRLEEKVKFCAGARDGNGGEGGKLQLEFTTKGGSSSDDFGGLRGDLRILPVMFDEAGERARRLDETVPYMSEQEF